MSEFLSSAQFQVTPFYSQLVAQLVSVLHQLVSHPLVESGLTALLYFVFDFCLPSLLFLAAVLAVLAVLGGLGGCVFFFFFFGVPERPLGNLFFFKGRKGGPPFFLFLGFL
ncbi:hypothetical protein [Vibrio parahaemolyticus]|uniref:hypothetical protein n=1 Tax=Vibrio parahaemolyticus TaxID=670 RepID=UPI001EE6C514|nr:hypothetical protein [Vibrio parahaemolyticus]